MTREELEVLFQRKAEASAIHVEAAKHQDDSLDAAIAYKKAFDVAVEASLAFSRALAEYEPNT